jgi:predicted lipoprotein
VKRRTLLTYMPFGALALIQSAQAATKTVAKGKLPVVAQPIVAAPYITPSQMVQGLLEQHLLPSSTALLQAAQALARSLAQPGVPWAEHRALWVKTMLAWEYLAAVAVGPLLERRSARAIDFWPTRPAQVQRLLQSGLGNITTVAQLDTVGASARGLPALEWLLWKTDGSGHALHYASLLAQQVEAESTAMLAGYKTLASTEREDSDAWTVYGEWFGQAVGGLDQLRIKKLVADTRGKDSAPWVRGVSGQTAACWQAQASGLQAFLVGSPATQAATEAATPGFPVAGSLNSLLLGRGHMTASQTLLTRTATMLRAVQAARPANAASLRNAQTALAQLSAQANGLAGEVLEITMGFTDADGD